jgi:thiol-disulfide isomerase/thioredoxin
MTGSQTLSGSLKAAGAIAGILACVAVIYLVSGPNGNQQQLQAPSVPEPQIAEAASGTVNKVTRELATGALSAFLVKANRTAVPELKFFDGQGRARTLKDWQGQVVLLNLWASWCAPCRKEMPSLEALQRRFGSKDFEVVAISVDRGGLKVAQKFLEETQARLLRIYVDPSAKAIETLRALGLPVTVLIDRQGREIGRLLGPADWSSPEALRLINVAINEGPAGS